MQMYCMMYTYKKELYKSKKRWTSKWRMYKSDASRLTSLFMAGAHDRYATIKARQVF